MEIPIPRIPNEIITKILSCPSLGKNDLLNCRLVSQSWNELSLKILRNPKYGHEHELTEDSIQKFLEFCNERNEDWVLPFHLNYFICNQYEQTIDIHQISKYIQQLQTIFGEECVVGLTLTHATVLSLEWVQEIISILTLIAPSLLHLDLFEFHVLYQSEEEELKVEEMLGKTQLNFPNLSKLKSCPAPFLMEDDDHAEQNKENNAIQLFLLKNSPNLKELEVRSTCGRLPMEVIEQIWNLRKLKIVNGLDDFLNLLEPIRICPVPVLKDLSLVCSSSLSELDYQILYDFLASLSTSLQSLTILFERIPTNPFPRLSQLRFLSIEVACSLSRPRRHVDAKKLNLTSEAFPVLESLDITANLYLESGEGDSGRTKECRVEFDYEAQESDELDLEEGDVITNVVPKMDGWWEGTLGTTGKRGLFPDNFVKVLISHSSSQTRRFKVLFSYSPEQEDELHLEVGDEVEFIDDVEEGWWRGQLKGRTGIFPSNFVTELESTRTDDWNLRTVRNLRVRVKHSALFDANAWEIDRGYSVIYPPGQYEDAIISRPTVNDYVNQLQKIFPNVSSLTLVNDRDGNEENAEYLIELLTAFVQSDGAPKIQELEIQGFEKNYLGSILNGLNHQSRLIMENVELNETFLKANKRDLQGFSRESDLRLDKQLELECRDRVENNVITWKAPIIDLKMTGLEKIRMSKRKCRQWGNEHESNQTDLFLMSLPKHLPLLRQIEISQFMFFEDIDFCKQQIINLQEKFPDLVINTTH